MLLSLMHNSTSAAACGAVRDHFAAPGSSCTYGVANRHSSFYLLRHPHYSAYRLT